jgi:hypothetical protein
MGGGYEKAIRKALDECLLTDAEWAQWEKVMNSKKLKTMEKKVRSQPAVDCPPPPPSLRRLTLVCAAKGARSSVRRRLRGVGGE